MSAVPLVRSGIDVYTLPNKAAMSTAQAAIRWHVGRQHTMVSVFREMYFQVISDYPSLPDPSCMTFARVAWYYQGLRGSLKSATKPKDM